jgi:hypothetical protein
LRRLASRSLPRAALTPGLTYPNPYTVAPAAVAKAFGTSAAPTGARTSEPGGAAAKTLPLCTFSRGSTMVKITVGPAAEASGGSGGVPGMKIVKPTGLGSTASMAYDHSARFDFTEVTFVKGPYWLSVWANGGVSTAKTLALAKAVYSAVA